MFVNSLIKIHKGEKVIYNKVLHILCVPKQVVEYNTKGAQWTTQQIFAFHLKFIDATLCWTCLGVLGRGKYILSLLGKFNYLKIFPGEKS